MSMPVCLLCLGWCDVCGPVCRLLCKFSTPARASVLSLVASACADHAAHCVAHAAANLLLAAAACTMFVRSQPSAFVVTAACQHPSLVTSLPSYVSGACMQPCCASVWCCLLHPRFVFACSGRSVCHALICACWSARRIARPIFHVPSVFAVC